MNNFALTFKDLVAWKKAYEFPSNEEFGIKSQIRRSAVSVTSNIAEGFKRKGKRDQIQFYNMAETSLEELKCQSMLSKDLNYFNNDEYKILQILENESRKLLNGWI